MKNKLYKILVFIFYLASLFILLFCFKTRFDKTIFIYPKIRVLLLFISCIFIYLSGLILVKKLNCSKKILKINLITYIIIYTVALIALTLFEELFGRRGLTLISWNKELLSNYMKYSFNIVPFKTINLFINGYINGYVTFRDFSINIFGNLGAFMPYGILIPLTFKKINKFYKFLILMIALILFIEVVQFLTLSGSCDIDDLILNLFGASYIYFIFKIKIVNKIINKIFLME